jgi:2'-hydroxyisoflavone reductase
MKTLVLGGTSFVGRAIVQDLLDRGHEPTLFTRGVTNPDLFPGVARVTGDRKTGDYASLTGVWDAVIDVSAYYPRQVEQALTALGDGIGRYLLISTVSVFDVARAPQSGLDEDSPRLPAVRDTEEVTGDTYGGLKVSCEDDLQTRLGDRATVVRPGIVAGPHDTTERFTYWARRASQGGRVALPGDPDQPVQVVDSRDLARLCTVLLEDDQGGSYNAVGPAVPVTFAQMITICAEAAGVSAEVVPVTTDQALPLVVPAEFTPMFRADPARAHAAGMPSTPLVRTAADTQAWDVERGLPALPFGFEPEEEKALTG